MADHTHEPTLFDLGSDIATGVFTSLNANPRQKKIDAALSKQSDAFKKSFRLYAEGYWSVNSSTVADVVAAYKRTKLPKPVSKDFRCVGGIVQSMVRKGEIVSVGTEKAADGSGRWMDIYSSVKG